MKKLILMAGLPKSGKSTKSREIMNSTPGAAIVNADSIRFALHGQRFIASAEPLVHAIAEIMVDALFRAGHDIVIVDECNVSKKRREPWTKYGDIVEVFIMPTSPAECIRRASNGTDDCLISVIKRMAGEWDLPIPWPKSEGVL